MGSGNKNIMKKVIKIIADEKGYSKYQYYKVEDWEIWRKIKKLKYDCYINEKQIKRLRKTLPRGYFAKYE